MVLQFLDASDPLNRDGKNPHLSCASATKGARPIPPIDRAKISKPNTVIYSTTILMISFNSLVGGEKIERQPWH